MGKYLFRWLCLGDDNGDKDRNKAKLGLRGCRNGPCRLATPGTISCSAAENDGRSGHSGADQSELLVVSNFRRKLKTRDAASGLQAANANIWSSSRIGIGDRLKSGNLWVQVPP